MMTSELDDSVLMFEVGVAIVPVDEGTVGSGDRDDESSDVFPGYEEASGVKLPGRRAAERVVVKGGEAVRAATEAIAGQIGLTAARIAAGIGEHVVTAPQPGEFGLESVEVSFGITLTGGVQAMFTAQAESSAQVNITLTRRMATGS
jgi:hypothetical protein